jgi:hypothetical protein
LKNTFDESLDTREINNCQIVFHPIPGFGIFEGFVDHFNCLPQLQRWIENVKNAKSQETDVSTLIITGIVKVGKSTVLDLIPYLLEQQHFAYGNFKICRICFEYFTRDNAVNFFQRLY